MRVFVSVYIYMPINMCTYKPREFAIIEILLSLSWPQIYTRQDAFVSLSKIYEEPEGEKFEYSYKSCIYKKKTQVSFFQYREPCVI